VKKSPLATTTKKQKASVSVPKAKPLAASASVAQKKAAAKGKPDTKAKQTELLTDLLKKKLDSKGITVEKAAERIGFSYSYLRFVFEGKYKWRSVGAMYFREIAKLADMSTTEAMSVAGILDTSDFINPDISIEDQLNELYANLSTDRRIRQMLPAKEVWMNSHQDMRLFISNLYQIIGTQTITRQLSDSKR